MAGSRMYYGNVLTGTRGAARVTCQIACVGSTAVPSIVCGRGFSVTGSNTTTFTLYMPERFGANSATWMAVDFIPQTTANSVYALISQAYTVPTTPTSASYVQYQVVAVNGAGVTTVAAVANPKGLLFFEAEFELGF